MALGAKKVLDTFWSLAYKASVVDKGVVLHASGCRFVLPFFLASPPRAFCLEAMGLSFPHVAS